MCYILQLREGLGTVVSFQSILSDYYLRIFFNLYRLWIIISSSLFQIYGSLVSAVYMLGIQVCTTVPYTSHVFLKGCKSRVHNLTANFLFLWLLNLSALPLKIILEAWVQ